MERTRVSVGVTDLVDKEIDNTGPIIDGSVDFVEEPGKTPETLGGSCCSGRFKEKDTQNKPYKVKHVYQKAGVYYSLQTKIKNTQGVSVELMLAVSYRYKPKNRPEITGGITLSGFARELNFRPYNGTRCLVSFTLGTTAYYKEAGQPGYTAVILDPISC